MKIEDLKIKKLNETATIPTYGTEYSAGADLYAALENDIEIKPGETIVIGTKLAMEIPTGFAGLIFARSSLGSKKGLAPANKVGVIDSDYRGEVKVPLFNHSNSTQTITKNERIAQIIFIPYLKANFIETESLEETIRGTGGFGSTNKNA